MKVNYTTLDGRLSVELDCSTQTELFEELAAFQEVFEDRTCRNKDGSESSNVRFQVREVDENKYYELVCVDQEKQDLRWAKRKFGCHKKGGGLFPKGGWTKWNKEEKAEFDITTGEKVEN